MNPRFAAWRRVYPDAPLYEFMIWIGRAMHFAFNHKLGVVDMPGLGRYYSSPQLRIADHDLFTTACAIFAAKELAE